MKYNSLPKAAWVYIVFSIVLVVLVLFMPRTAKFGFEYRKGAPWKYENLIAQVDFPILKTAEQIEDEKDRRTSGEIPYYRYSSEVSEKAVRAVENMDFLPYRNLRSSIVRALVKIFSKGIVGDEGIVFDKAVRDPDNAVIYVHKGKRASLVPCSEVYKLSAARSELLSELLGSNPDGSLDSLLSANGIYELLQPNLSYDKQMTLLVCAENEASISPSMGYVNAGQRIVSKGEIVTAEIAQMLDSYRVEYEATMGYGKPRIFLWLGNFLVSLIIVFALFFSIWLTNPKIFYEKNRLCYLLFIFTLTALIAMLVSRSGSRYLMLVPFALGALYLKAFFRNTVVASVYMISLLPILFTSEMGVVVYFVFLIAGITSTYYFQFFNRSWKQFITALIAFAFGAGAYIGFYLINMTAGSILKALPALLISCLASVVAYQLVYIFEKIFNLVSSSRLDDLADTSNTLLRELNERAPGTYQHCINVMGMAEACARAIDADVPLVKVGALYHDIGKMKNPTCFIENQALLASDLKSSFHDGLTPLQSAKFIIDHVSAGMEMAKEAGLPEIVSDFILTHHGNGCVTYFYNKFLEQGGSPEDKAQFCYTGKIPSTKEQIILMLCDSVEAGSRTIKSKNSEAFDEFVERIVSGKMSEGQFLNADISIKELGVVKAELKNYLAQIYHKRIAYPKIKG